MLLPEYLVIPSQAPKPDFWRLGLLGGPRVAVSPSPFMHNSVLESLDMPGEYTAMDVAEEDIGGALGRLFAENYYGLNVTTPHKIAVMDFLTGISPEASFIGSVNTLVRQQEGFYGHNTDAQGFTEAYMGELVEYSGPRCLIMGAGGAARAVAAGLYSLSRGSFITARNFEKAQKLAGHFRLTAIPWEELGGVDSYTCLINATSSSNLADFGTAAEAIRLESRALVIDINYARNDNWFRRLAEGSGGMFRDGTAMLASQAKFSFETWTGIDAGIGNFLGALRRHGQKAG
jgi:shikimate dehydrogenase